MTTRDINVERGKKGFQQRPKAEPSSCALSETDPQSGSDLIRHERDELRGLIARRTDELHNLDKKLIARALLEEFGPNPVKFTIRADQEYGESEAEYTLYRGKIQTSADGTFESSQEVVEVIEKNLSWESRVKFSNDFKPDDVFSDEAKILINTETGEWTRDE